MTTQVITQNIDSNVKGMRAVMRGGLGGKVEILTMNNTVKQNIKSIWFYKGSGTGMIFPQSSTEVSKNALEMIMMGIKDGWTKQEQIEDYISQLDSIEEIIYVEQTKYLAEHNGILDMEEYIEGVSKKLHMSSDGLHSIWALNIAALLIMKAIPNNEMFGYVDIEENCEIVTREVEADAFIKVIHELKNTPKLYESSFNHVFTLDRFWVLAKLKDTPYSLGEINLAGRGSNEDIDRGGRHDKKFETK